MQIMMKKIALGALLVVLSLHVSAQSNSSEIYLLDIVQKDGKQIATTPYRITQNDEVHIYGLMPNARIVGWWLMGDILTAELWLGLHDEVAA